MIESPLDNGASVVRLTLYSNGQKVDDSITVVSVFVSRRINMIPKARIVIEDGDMPEQNFPVSNMEFFKPGNEIKIAAGYDQQEETIFKGIIIRHGITITGNNKASLVIEGSDKAVAMTIGRKNANFVELTDSDIMSKLIGRHKGLSADVASTVAQYNQLVQYDCTDWDFLLCRAEVNGLLVMVDDNKVMVKAPKTNGSAELKVTYGESLMEFHADMDARTQLTSVTGTSWDLKSQKTAEESSEAKKLNDQGDIDSAALAKVAGPDTFRLQTAAPLDKTALKAWTEGRQIKAGLARIRGRMKFQGSALARIGELIELEGVGDHFSGRVFVSEVSHEITGGDWLTEVSFGMSPSWFAERRDLVSPPASGLLPGVEGLQIGVVKKLDADPDGQYKIQVAVPVLQAESEGVWARLATFYASENIGSFFVPEIGDEVVLGYFNNDPAHPVVLGSLFSSTRKPPNDLTAENFIKTIVTKSNVTLEFDDEKKSLAIKTPGGNSIVVSDDEQSILLTDQNNNTIGMGPDGIVLDSPKDITINAKGKLTLKATGETTVSSQADVKISGLNINNDANVGFVAKGSASAELSASGQTTIKGAMVMIN